MSLKGKIIFPDTILSMSKDIYNISEIASLEKIKQSKIWKLKKKKKKNYSIAKLQYFQISLKSKTKDSEQL